MLGVWVILCGYSLATLERLLALLNAAIGLFVFGKRPADFAARLLFLLTAIVLAVHISEFIYWGLPEIIHPRPV